MFINYKLLRVIVEWHNIIPEMFRNIWNRYD